MEIFIQNPNQSYAMAIYKIKEIFLETAVY